MTTLLPKNAAKACNAAYKTTFRKDTLQVLTHFHLYTQDGWLIVESCNLETASRENIAARVENEINLCVPARAFKDWMQVMAKNYSYTVKFWVDGLTLKAEYVDNGVRSRTQFNCMTSNDFPPIDQFLPA